ncbi:hypothetical protein SH449x_003679 [Pirellulaceae bacterium SH449]
MVTTILDKMLQTVTDQMPPDFARKLLELRADEEFIVRIDELRSKANAGQLTESEDQEYREIVEAIDIISLLQAKAKSVLSANQ